MDPDSTAGPRWSVRRFAAIDMYGTAGTLRRRRLVLAEFVLGTVCLVVVGVLFTLHGGWLWGVWLLGCALSYGALAIHAITLYPWGNLEAELRGVDTAAEIRRYSAAQLLLFVPGLIAVVALAQALRHRPGDVNSDDGAEERADPR